jgi:hypothetical protein
MMTAQDFLRVLAKTPRDWRLEGGKIRRGPPLTPACPLTAVAQQVIERGPAAGVSWDNGLPLDPGTVERIVAACDDHPSADPTLRARMLEACGLAGRCGDGRQLSAPWPGAALGGDE